MSTLAIQITTAPDVLPEHCVAVRPGGTLSHVRRTCTAHRADAYCVGRDHDAQCLVYWCDEGQHVLAPRGTRASLAVVGR
ncbi:MAG: hypothetical protein EXQ74_00925 [Thermoleophilia bacterium]|nr:hypothetical protein [Thermoleophilia bacterium]